MRATKINIGDVFGRLTVKECLGSQNGRGIVWRCKCVCGGVKEARAGDLGNGKIKSCGCLLKEKIPNLGKKNINRKLSPLAYVSWRALRRRCRNPNGRDYKYYGGRGIKVCERWKNSFDNFLKDMGDRPGKEYSIERKENSKGYEPGNCVWATRVEQMNNKSSNVFLEVGGVRKTVAQWAIEIGENSRVLYWRKKRGDSDEDVVNVPVRKATNPLVKKKAVELCLSGMSAREVREMLCNEFGQNGVPRERAIKRWVEESGM
jgi:hypothetical protein